MKNIYILLIGMTLFAGCKKEDQNINITVVNQESGSLAIKVLNNSNQPVGNAKFSIASFVFSSSSSSYYNILVTDSTDSNGEYNIGKLLQGEYSIYVSTKSNNITYSDEIDFQIIAGDNKIIQVFPFKNVGSIKLQILNSNTDSPYSNLNVAILDGYYSSNSTFQYLLSKVILTQTTNTDGWVSFNNVPAGNSYYLLFYYDSSHYYFGYSNVNAYKNEEMEYIINVIIP